MTVEINLLRELQLKESILISGLPGIAYIGKLSAEYLIQELKAELVGEVYSNYFPPYVLIKKDGTVELLKNEIYCLKEEAEKRVFFFTGNAQAASPKGQYEIANAVLDTTMNLGVKRIYSIAAFLTNNQFKKPKVFGTTTNPELLREVKKFGVNPMKNGIISGINGLIFGLAKRKQLEGVCLLGETRGYQTATGQYLLDAKAVRAVLEVLSKITNLKVDMKPLEKQSEQMDELIEKITKIERQMKDEMKLTSEKSAQYIT
jgi:uncharacterized protein (TIGR00162 family)